MRAVYDLSATPFFLRGSGYQEGTLFPWVVSDFSLIDAIESGIVKLPRVPVTDNLVQTDTVVYRDLWKHIGKSMPKSTASANKLSPFDLNPLLLTALAELTPPAPQPAPCPSGLIQIELPGGVRVSVDAGVDAGALARVLSVLR
nr:hypothetical protein [Sphingomonas adhaesiva]